MPLFRNNTFAAPLDAASPSQSSPSLPPLARRNSSTSSIPTCRRGSMCSVSSSVTGGGGGASACQVSEDLDGNRRILKGIKKMSKQQRRSISESVLSPADATSSSFRVKASSGSRSRRDSVSGGSITSRSSNGGRRSSRGRSGSISDYAFVDPGIPKSICLS